MANASDQAERDKQLKTDEQQAVADFLKEEIDKSEAQLTHSRNELAVVGERIRVKVQQLDMLVRQQDTALAEFTKKKHKAQQELDKLAEKVGALRAQVSDVGHEVEKRQQMVSLAKKEFLEVKEEIRDRQAYRYQQEDMIDKALADGNEQLKNVQAAIDGLTLDKANLLRQNMDLEDKHNEIVRQIGENDKALVKLTAQKISYEATMRDSATRLEEQTSSARKHLKEVNDEVDKRLHNASVIEVELTMRQKALDKFEQDLQDREARFKSQQAIYKF